MSEKLDQEQPMVWGAPEVAPDPELSGFDVGRPRLGGHEEPVEFSDRQVEILNAAADEIIPPGEGFPAPSEVDVVDFIGRYTAPSGEKALHYPFAEEDEFKAAIDNLGDEFLQADGAGRVEILKRVEKEDETFFTQLRNMVFYGYYSRPAVTLAIQENLPAARDYHGPPQPYGYIRTIERWSADEETFNARGGGNYIATEDVKRIDLSKIGWIQNSPNGQQ
ncbi:gluconate 2-dehydrogenase subunit 3 family protein [Rubrobacter marinus]|uniref:Gluconate 2-dehydrogenase subunit 3 family protein n=1 Tax=Rubrobacter marinus TaxID=2653852 RepID=A0A6G8PSP8_9ACTN|nr:gluconate 2-dehydrogenase subunit 3 family protein [Rubrobacter marinus]QIN77460.1 gluconate 2-dehydrogenase subunit 3 family protein [Rubrobacter marinus]